MYHIAEDKRAVNSAKLIEKGIIACLDSKDFNDISVTDICKASGVSRATFYRLFDIPSDILRWGCDRTYRELLAEQDEAAFDPKAAMHFMLGHSEAIEAAVRCHRSDLIQDALTKHMAPVIARVLGDAKASPFSESRKKYLMNMFIGTMTSVLSTWIGNGRKESEAELRELILIYSELFDKMSRRV